MLFVVVVCMLLWMLRVFTVVNWKGSVHVSSCVEDCQKANLVSAGSPELAMVPTVQGIVVMMFSTPILGQEVMKFHGVQGFPCSLMLWMNMLVPSLYITSMELRALRVVIIFNEEYRKRFGILMTNK
eukprot:13197-Heterococcus_DN1.PRE.1